MYSNVKKPAFFIPFMDYYQSVGSVLVYEWNDDDQEYQTTEDGHLKDLHLLNPSKIHRFKGTQGWYQDTMFEHIIRLKGSVDYEELSDEDGYIYMFILGHNLFRTDSMVDVQIGNWDSDSFYNHVEYSNIVNSNGAANAPSSNGFSIIKMKFNPGEMINTFKINIRGFSADSDEEILIGSISFCKKWTPPHSPDLSLKMGRSYDGIKTIKTKGGATISNAQHTRPAFWVNGYAWELNQITHTDFDENHWTSSHSRTLGRRFWDLNFSYLQPTDIMPITESFTAIETDDYSISNREVTIHQDSSFYSSVLNKVQGSHLPFIFLPNYTDSNFNPDQWAICRFNQKKFTVGQKAPELYSMKLKIEESW